MNTIFALGGGSIERSTFSIDREIVEYIDKQEVKALFIPTASENPEDYISSEEYFKKFEKTYGSKLGCETGVLNLVKDNPSREKIKEKISDSDLVYVGGGNTRRMMNIWQDKGVNRILKEAWSNGTIMSGLSAGAICWFEHGHSDSESYVSENDWDFIKVDGLNMIENIIFCPHYHKEKREDSFQKMMDKNPGKTGLAVDNNAAIKIQNGKLDLIKSKNTAKAYIIRKNSKQELKTEKTYPIKDIMNRGM